MFFIAVGNLIVGSLEPVLEPNYTEEERNRRQEIRKVVGASLIPGSPLH